MRRLTLLSVATLVIMATQPNDARAQETDEEAIIRLVDEMFEALAAKDTAAMRAMMVPGTRLVITTFNQAGDPVYGSVSLDQLFASLASGPPMREDTFNPEVMIHDNLASIWVDYDFWVGDTLDHCGKDNFQLARDGEGWKFIALADTQRREGCVPGAD